MGFFKKLTSSIDPISRFKGLSSGSDPGKKQLGSVLQAQRETAMQNRSLFAQAKYEAKQGQKAIDSGFKAANSVLGQAAATGRQRLLDRETANLGALKAGVADSGMGGTSTATNLQRAVYSDSSRDLAGFDAEIAGIKADLEARRAAATAGQFGSLAGISQNQAGASNALGQSLINSLSNVQYADPNQWLNSLLGITGTFAGAQIGRR